MKKNLGLWWKNFNWEKKLPWINIFFLIGTFIVGFVWFIFWALNSNNTTDKTIDTFIEKNSMFSVIFLFLVQAVFAILSGIRKKIDGDFYKLNVLQKEKIRILDIFSNNPCTNDTIFSQLMEMLGRCSENKEDDVQLLMLMCSPLVDYPERITSIDQYNQWGDVFKNKITDIISNNNEHHKPKNIFDMKIYYLSNENILGRNQLDEFIESLAGYSYLKDKTKSKMEQVFSTIKKQTDEMIAKLKRDSDKYVPSPTDNLENQAIKKIKKIKIVPIKKTDIPFQIFIYKTKRMSEVIVSFAGKTILQSRIKTEVKGFHSVDTDVVNAFENILNTYVIEHSKISLKPMYTQEIINKTMNDKNDTIKQYLGIDMNLRVNKKIYSPYHANSSKFTSHVLNNILKKGNSVLDIGSGTGIQAIMAYTILKNLDKKSIPTVYAIEPFEESFNILKQNVSSICEDKIHCNQFELSFCSENNIFNISKIKENDSNSEEKEKFIYENCGIKKEITDEDFRCFRGVLVNKEDNEIVQNFGDKKFDIIIGDLPFVDAEPDKENLECAFFDSNHLNQQALFRLFKDEDNKYIKDDAKLITSFSTLGGSDDVNQFEMLITKNNLVVIQKFSFNEADYLWFVYVIVKKENLVAGEYMSKNDFYLKENYWRKKLEIFH